MPTGKSSSGSISAASRLQQKASGGGSSGCVGVDEETGFRIYTEASFGNGVGIMSGGNTPLCPFDCKCCF
jgi:hypothetical protein